MNDELDTRKAFSEDSYYSFFKTVRNRIRKFDSDALIDRCFEYLHAPAPKQFEYLKRHPWIVLLIVKWTLLDDEVMTTGRPRPTQEQFLSLLQLTFTLEEKGRLPTEFEDISLFFRAIAYQQFLYQRRASVLVVGRQMLYFADLPDGHYIAQTFESLTGLKLRRFLTLSQVLILAFAEAPSRRFIDASFFGTLGSGFSQQEIERFISLFTTSRAEMRKFLLDLDASIIQRGALARNASEIYEQTPFLERPLIRRYKSYECIDVHLLDVCVGRFVYSRLRGQGNAEKKLFMSHFGPIFEAYVRKAIVHMNLPFQEETEMAQLVATKNKPSLVDFVVTDDGSRIFIDAKAVEMHYRGKVTHSTS